MSTLSYLKNPQFNLNLSGEEDAFLTKKIFKDNNNWNGVNQFNDDFLVGTYQLPVNNVLISSNTTNLIGNEFNLNVNNNTNIDSNIEIINNNIDISTTTVDNEDVIINNSFIKTTENNISFGFNNLDLYFDNNGFYFRKKL